jgi:hypothetical protein
VRTPAASGPDAKPKNKEVCPQCGCCTTSSLSSKTRPRPPSQGEGRVLLLRARSSCSQTQPSRNEERDEILQQIYKSTWAYLSPVSITGVPALEVVERYNGPSLNNRVHNTMMTWKPRGQAAPLLVNGFRPSNSGRRAQPPAKMTSHCGVEPPVVLWWTCLSHCCSILSLST